MMRTTVNDDGLRRSLTVSAGLHLALILFMYFGLPHLMKPLPKPYVQIPFEIMEIGEITNTRVKMPDEVPTPPAPPPAPEMKTETAAPPTPPAPKPPEQVEALTMPKPAEKPKPPEEVKPKDNASFSKLLKDLKQKTQDAPKSEQKTEEKSQTQSSTQAPALTQRLTISEEDALRRQISQCWNPPVGAKDSHNLIVDVKIDVNPDRTVRAAEVVDKGRMAMDSFYRAAGESAIRALYNPKCSPLELPADKYDQWKTISFTFDPRNL